MSNSSEFTPQFNDSSLLWESMSHAPDVNKSHGRFCTTCGVVIEMMALEQYQGLKCMHCNTLVEFVDQEDGLYRRCVRCCVFLRCTAMFCYMCGRKNQHFDPDKPARLQLELKNKPEQLVGGSDLQESSAVSQPDLDDLEFEKMLEQLKYLNESISIDVSGKSCDK